jgi:hypothetical protein
MEARSLTLCRIVVRQDPVPVQSNTNHAALLCLELLSVDFDGVPMGEDDVVPDDPGLGIALVPSNELAGPCPCQTVQQLAHSPNRFDAIHDTHPPGDEARTHGANCPMLYPNADEHHGSLNVNQCCTLSPNRSKHSLA